MPTMNELILEAAGREDGDQPNEQKPSGMSRLLLEAMPTGEQIIFKKRDE